MMQPSLANGRIPPARISRFDVACYAITCLVLAGDAWRLIGAVARSAPATPGLALDRAAVGVCLVLLAVLGWRVWRKSEVDAAHAFAIGAVAGAIFFAGTFGAAVLDPTAIDWLLRGDWATHYAGWAMFRNTPWSWPPGALPTLMYPVGSAIVYPDSLPLLALLFKPFAAWLPEPFQYTGGWFTISCILQGAFGALLTQRWTRSAALIVAAAALFLYAPIFLYRFGHATLTAHWLILACLWLYFRPQPPRSLSAEAWPWWLLAGLSALVMPYLAMMVLAIAVAYWVRRVWVDRGRSFGEAAFVGTVAVALMATLWYLSGAWIIKYHDGGGGVAYGFYSFNLLGFFNAGGRSRLLPALPLAGPQQAEGFSYLGLGVFFLLSALLAEMLLRRRKLSWPREHWPLAVVALLLVAYAASTVLTLGSWTLINHPLATPLLATFRSSGRFVWIAYYLITLGAIVLVCKRLPHTLALLLVTGAVAVQAWDFSLARLYFGNLRSGEGWPKPEQPLRDARWDQLNVDRSHLTLIPPISCGVQPGSYLPFQLLAAKHSMSLNTGYVARWNPGAEQQYCAQLVGQLAEGKLSADDLYVVADDWLERFTHASDPQCQMLEGFRACTIVPASAAGTTHNH